MCSFMSFSKFLLLSAFLAANQFLWSQSSHEIIKINQSGYYVSGPKLAIATSDFKSDEYAGDHFGFYILKYNSKDTVYQNSLGAIGNRHILLLKHELRILVNSNRAEPMFYLFRALAILIPSGSLITFTQLLRRQY